MYPKRPFLSMSDEILSQRIARLLIRHKEGWLIVISFLNAELQHGISCFNGNTDDPEPAWRSSLKGKWNRALAIGGDSAPG